MPTTDSTAPPTSRFITFQQVCEEEHARIRDRRKKADIKGLDESKLLKDTVGLALSGGGVRSATFNLGVLQALHRHGILKRVDYLSTVSGGGYIGSCLTWFCSRKGRSLANDFPFGTDRKDNLGEPGLIRAWLRDHGKVITPGKKMGFWAFVGSILSASVFNLLIVVPYFLLALVGLRQEVPASWWNPQRLPWPHVTTVTGYDILRLMGYLLVFVFLLRTLLRALTSAQGWKRRANQQTDWFYYNGILLKLALVCVLLGSLPAFYEFAGRIGQAPATLLAAVTSIASIVGARKGEQKGKITSKAMLGFLLWLGAASILAVLLLVMFGVAAVIPLPVLWGTVVVATLLIFTGNTNYTSAHRYYRNALMRAYLPTWRDLHPTGKEESSPERTADDPDIFRIRQIASTDAPYHLINTAMNTMGSEEPKLAARGAENFIFSPLHSGCSNSYLRMPDVNEPVEKAVDEGRMKLATAMAVSGAAVNPNMYATRARPISFLMTLFNIRLGYWISRPARGRWYEKRFLPARVLKYMVAEMFGRGLKETSPSVHLSDGGHFENLGLYELIRRRCKYIVVIDAGQDKDRFCGDLGKAIELVRMDFGAKITIDLEPMHKKENDSPANEQEAFAVGRIEYLPAKGDEPPLDEGYLLYIKPTLLKNMSRDVETYALEYPNFPHESTADQSYDERQFESYRESGWQVIQHVWRDLAENDTDPGLADFFKWVEAKAPKV
jgi:hypothetical protein